MSVGTLVSWRASPAIITIPAARRSPPTARHRGWRARSIRGATPGGAVRRAPPQPGFRGPGGKIRQGFRSPRHRRLHLLERLGWGLPELNELRQCSDRDCTTFRRGGADQLAQHGFANTCLDRVGTHRQRICVDRVLTLLDRASRTIQAGEPLLDRGEDAVLWNALGAALRHFALEKRHREVQCRRTIERPLKRIFALLGGSQRRQAADEETEDNGSDMHGHVFPI